MAALRINRILCPTDFSELAVDALRYARGFAETFGTELHLLHVVDEAYQYWMAMGPNSLPIGPTADEILTSARDHMARWQREHCEGLVPAVSTEVLVGRPFVEIVRYARDKGVGLIILGTHGRSGLSHVLLGSVTEKVVRKAPCPVLVVRHPDQKFEMP